MRGTIWAVSHTSEQAFERPDYELLKSLSEYVTIIVRQQGRMKNPVTLPKLVALSERVKKLLALRHPEE